MAMAAAAAGEPPDSELLGGRMLERWSSGWKVSGLKNGKEEGGKGRQEKGLNPGGTADGHPAWPMAPIAAADRRAIVALCSSADPGRFGVAYSRGRP